MTAGEIVLAYNLPGQPKNLKLPRDVYPDIFLGKITKLERSTHRGGKPGHQIARSADHRRPAVGRQRHQLCVHEAPFGDQPGIQREGWLRDDRSWPQSDKFVAAPKNDGVTATIKQTPGAIGYIEYGYAKLTKADTALAAKRCWQLCRGGRRIRRGCARQRSTARGLDRLGRGPCRIGLLSDCQLHLDALLREAGCAEG